MEAQIIKELKMKFTDKFGEKPTSTYFSPGRVNLIGEHVDYNGGHVLPCAITQGTLGIVRLREDGQVNCLSENFEELGIISFDLEELSFNKEDNWTNYVKGMIKYIQEAGHKVDRGFDLLIYGNIPNGAGLSSSASLELLIGVMLEHEFDLDLERLDLVKLGQKVENEFIGLNSGIMDQFAVGMGKEGSAIYLDVNTLDYTLVPAEFGDNVILIMNTNKRRELAESKYNQRRQECETALKELQSELSIQTLGDLSNEEFDSNVELISNDILVKRARHAVYENSRTQEAVEMLKENKLEAFGELLNKSHVSLRDDYDVTGIELDTLVEAAWKQKGVLGARMTGAGMGGCAIALVNKGVVADAIELIGTEYKDKIGYKASFYIAEIGDGAKKLEA
ncbi:galactokinase [Ruoffia tabacinasalis]|uniref:Galactokinase n=1 Tax=Ruoffia tabacinasalis TaxID=87458 RepID=A0ABS0LM69_9LACT|nr:galactokinase [Ruoffia tabacinasalis]MBG9978524.1 galactokinase [Ruoffia tabacinasalis]